MQRHVKFQPACKKNEGPGNEDVSSSYQRLLHFQFSDWFAAHMLSANNPAFYLIRKLDDLFLNLCYCISSFLTGSPHTGYQRITLRFTL